MAGHRYKKLEKIGSGSYGTVWMVSKKDICSVKPLVLKEISLRGMCAKDVNQSLTEVEVLARCKHENIIAYKEAFLSEDADVLSIVMEYASGGDLHNQITQRRGLFFPDETILGWFSQLASALDYIHARCILHRDIKPQNLLVTSKRSLKLGDFGIARMFSSHTDKACTMIGTPFYLSPEICRQELYSYASDMWSAGCVLYEMCCLSVPFTASNMAALVVRIQSAKYTSLPSHCSPILHSLVKSLLDPDPNNRPTARQINLKDITKTRNIALSNEKSTIPDSPTDCCSLVDMDGKGKLAKRRVDSTTYTVVKHPKPLRPSLASPELTAMLKKQRTLTRDGHRAVASADNPPPRPPKLEHVEKRGISPCFNLLESEMKRKRREDKDPGTKVRGCSGEDSSPLWDVLSKDVYTIYTSSCSARQKEAAMKHRLVEFFGYDRCQQLLAAVSEKSEYDSMCMMEGFSPKCLPIFLLYLELKSV